MRYTVSLIYGSVRKERKGIKVARYLEKKLTEKGMHVHFIDPLKYQLPLLDKTYKEYEAGKAPDHLERLSEQLEASDGFLLLTGEYNHTLPPALTNLLDHFHTEYRYKPSAIASYSTGSFGGVRAADHLRILAGQLGMPAIPAMLHFPRMEELFDDELISANPRIDKNTVQFFNEFEWYMRAMKQQREMNTAS